MFVPRTEVSRRLRLVGHSSSLGKLNVINCVSMVSECSGGSGHSLLLKLFSSSALAHTSHQLHSRQKALCRGRDISEEPSPAKVDSHRCHTLETKVDLFLASCLCAYLLGRFAVNY